jgi:aubergine-like protein
MVNPVKVDIMFVGIDSAHDPLKKAQSVMCLVASLNNECTRYFSKSATGPSHQELGSEIHLMMQEALEKYRSGRGKFPDHIIIFRDGGSEGAISTMRDSEGAQMKEAAKICGPEVKLTYVIVNKRISQRFFQEDKRQVINPLPGTIVDSIVTRLEHYDFYVVSQKVGQGTVNPTHFTVIDPSDPIRPDLIQKLAYVTCFMYYNWSGTVRVPAMVQYAHKLAALLSKSVNGTPDKRICTTLYYL